MVGVLTIVFVELICGAVDNDFCLAYAVGNTAYDGTI